MNNARPSGCRITKLASDWKERCISAIGHDPPVECMKRLPQSGHRLQNNKMQRAQFLLNVAGWTEQNDVSIFDAD